ncbi:MAG: hypothetical protein A3J83_06140 [Elusimicrobia bacterium RIFOXYA2_FULL_40_6]|nr:MAG: hypothetical protein A3J83_06140 [Elusimicrobia bacterium RIFOXYA2_FULL_40_6]
MRELNEAEVMSVNGGLGTNIPIRFVKQTPMIVPITQVTRIPGGANIIIVAGAGVAVGYGITKVADYATGGGWTDALASVLYHFYM